MSSRYNIVALTQDKSAATSPTQQPRNRKDHWLPQGCLRGFIGPSSISRFKPFCCFFAHSQKWRHVSPKEIAYGEGFYDYADRTDYAVASHSDSAFARLEREFPQHRDAMAANAFAEWEQHRAFLLEFMQMMRARSPLAMQQQEAEARTLRGATITKVHPDGRTIEVDSLELRPLPEHAIRNFTISKVLEQVNRTSATIVQIAPRLIISAKTCWKRATPGGREQESPRPKEVGGLTGWLAHV